MTNKRTKHVSEPVESPFADFLTGNRTAPSFQECKAIQELLAEKTAHLARLNSKVPRRGTGRKIPRKLRAELDVTRRFIKLHQALIAPWRRLPTEIMAEIFLFSLAVTLVDEMEDHAWEDDRAGTLLLCKICKSWREIALSTPGLWNIISIDLHPLSQSYEWLSMWLQRSRSIPVYLQVFWEDQTPVVVINRVISAFASHLHHAAGLWIDGLNVDSLEFVGPTYPRPTFPAFASSRAPLLTTLGADLPPGSDWEWICAAARGASRLSHLHTSKIYHDWFPISHLTKLHFIDPCTMSDLLRVLEQSPCLEDIFIDVEGPDGTSPSGNTVVLEKLFRLEVTSSDHLGQFFEQVKLPGLAHMVIHGIGNWPEGSFKSLLSRSSCALKLLGFSEVVISGEQVIACLQLKACETIEHFGLAECGAEEVFTADPLVEYLTFRGVPHPNARLQAIELVHIKATDGLLAALAESRILPFPPLPPDAVPPSHLTKFRFSLSEGHALSQYSHPRDNLRFADLERNYPGIELIWKDDLEE